MVDPSQLDPRVNAFRPDLADASLQAIVRATYYVEPVLRQCVRGVVPLLAEPRSNAKRVSEVRYGEFLDVLEQRTDGFAWVQNRSDRYVGYLPMAGVLSEEIAALSYRINALHSFVYLEADLKSPIQDRLTLGSYVRVLGQYGDYFELASGGFVFTKHVVPTEQFGEADYVFTAGKMLGVPYLWGGRTPLGLDCSGLVQLSLELAGVEAPRDADQQMEAFGQPLPAHWRDIKWNRGDIVFFPGHVGIMTSHDHIIHANAFEMRVTAEPLAEVIKRGSEITMAGKPLIRNDFRPSNHSQFGLN